MLRRGLLLDVGLPVPVFLAHSAVPEQIPLEVRKHSQCPLLYPFGRVLRPCGQIIPTGLFSHARFPYIPREHQEACRQGRRMRVRVSEKTDKQIKCELLALL